jgi:hypothetical protein
MKKVFGILIVLGVLGVAAFFVLNNPLGRLVKIAIEGFAPDMIKAEVQVSSVTISATDGHGRLNGFTLGNPKGFKSDHALKADTIELVMEPVSIAKDVVVLHKVLIDSPHISFESGDKGNNFDAIQRNVESYLGASKGEKEDKGKGKGKGKKLIIDSFVIRNAKVNYNDTVDLALPDIEMKDIGKNSGGATPAQVTKMVVVQLNAKIALAIAKAAAIGSVGGVAIGAGLAVKNMLGK